MKIDLDIPDAMVDAVVRSPEGRMAISVAANVLEAAYDKLEEHVKGGGSLDEWLVDARGRLAEMRRDLA